jgi:hypothetical protein
MSADMGQVADVGLKLIPVALIGKTDDRIKFFLPHQFPYPVPAASSLGVCELPQSKTPLGTVNHRSAARFLSINHHLIGCAVSPVKNNPSNGRNSMIEFRLKSMTTIIVGSLLWIAK